MNQIQSAAKAHEHALKASYDAEKVQSIIKNASNTPYALRGLIVKTALYAVFSAFAVLELCAALYFYAVGVYSVGSYAAGIIAFLIASGLHFLLHHLLTDAAVGIVFQKKHESNAMRDEVTFNIIVSIVLCLVLATVVNYFGKSGFNAVRSNQYELKTIKSDSSVNIQTVPITPEMLTNKLGKISTAKLGAIANITKAQTDAIKANTANTDAQRQAYNATTAQIVETVGASAFVLEFLLMLLAFAIATAKKAASLDTIVKNQSDYQGTNNAIGFQLAQPTASVNTDAVAQNTPKTSDRQIGFGLTDAVKLRICEHCSNEYIYKIHNQKYCNEVCRIAAWELKTGKTLKKKRLLR